MKTIKQKLQSNIRKFYAMKFFYWICFVIPVLVIFWQNNWLSMTEIMLLQSIYAILVVILEVPSWYFADAFWRKLSITIATFTRFIWNFIYSIWHWFSDMLIAEILFAIGVSALSWADSSFIYDNLKELWKEKNYKKIRWNAHFIFLCSMWFAQVIWWLIAKFWLPFNFFSNIDNIRLTIFVSLPFLFFAIPFALSLYEAPHHKKTIKKGYLQDLFLVLKKEVIWNKRLLRIMLFFMFLGASLQFALRFYQPYFKLINLDLIYRGFVFWWFQIFSWLVSKYAHQIEQKIWLTKTIVLSAILVIVSYFGMWLTFTVIWLIFTFFQQFVRWINQVVISDYIHQNVSSTYRATIQSIQSLWRSLTYALFLPFFGRATDFYSLSQALIIIWITVSILLIPLLIFLFWKKILLFRK